MVEQGMRNQVNYTSMSVHAFSFTLYNISVIVFYYSYFRYLQRLADLPPDVSPENPLVVQYTDSAIRTWIITTYTTFIAQLCLIWIFTGFRIKEEEKPERAMTRVEIEGDDDVLRL